MANNIFWGRIYEYTNWGIGVVTNTISWGKIYADLVGALPSFALNFANIATDFTFTRSSFATRVNEQGLIETVTDLGSELVQNGDFEEMSSELITNGDFATDLSGWSIQGGGTNWVWDNGSALMDGTTDSALIADFVGNNTALYEVTVDFTTTGTKGCRILDADSNNLFLVNGTNTFTTTLFVGKLYLKPFNSNGTGEIRVDNVSVKQVDPNDEWSFSNVSGDNGWRIADGRAICDATGALNGRNLQQTLPTTLIAGQTYRLSLDILQSADAMQISLGGVTQFSLPIGTNLGYSIDFIPTTTSNFLTIFGGTSDLQEIDNISVQEVLEDDVPRIDYTNGEAEFLLEPQSTNLITYSEDFSQWDLQGNTLNLVSGVAPDGNTSVYELTSVSSGKCQSVVSGLSVNTKYTFSFYVKQTSATTLVYSRVLSLTGGSGGSNLIEVTYQDQLVTDEWVRITHTFTTNDTLGNYIVYVSNSLTAGESLQFWGAQVEEGSYATSYIPTNGSAVTRSAELCVDATPTINSEEGTLYFEASALDNDGSTSSISLNDGTSSVVVVIRYRNTTNQIQYLVKDGVNPDVGNILTLSDATQNNKFALKWKNQDIAFWINGVEESTSSATISISGLTDLDFDTFGAFYGRTKDLKIYTEALSDSQLEELTTI